MSGKADPKYLASLRTTEKMGAPRDTVQDPPRTFDEESSAVAARAAALGPRGTVVVAKKAAPPVEPPTDKNVAGQVVIGVGKQPNRAYDGKVDVSRVDPRRAPTRKIDRRPDQYLKPDSSVASRPRKTSMSPTVIGLIAIGVLAAIAVLLGLLILKQRAGG